jgi:hypothetical protein
VKKTTPKGAGEIQKRGESEGSEAERIRSSEDFRGGGGENEAAEPVHGRWSGAREPVKSDG